MTPKTSSEERVARQPKMNVRLLRRAQKYILAEPRRIDMRQFGTVFDLTRQTRSETGLPLPPCGTTACIAGTIAILEGKTDPVAAKRHLKLFGGPYFFGGAARSAAESLLRITYEQAERLFYFKAWRTNRNGWPDKYATAYDTAKTPAGRARVTVRRIDHFIKTNGAE